MMRATYDAVTKLTDVSRERYGDFSYAAGYFSSMVSSMIFEMRTRGGKQMTEMADYYERMLQSAIINITTESK